MTTEEIRKSIHVNGYGLFDKGLRVYYTWYNNRNDKGSERVLTLTETDAIEELTAMGEIYTNDWEWIADNYNLSQWDALNLVIRHELNKAAKAEIENADIGKAINNVLKS